MIAFSESSEEAGQRPSPKRGCILVVDDDMDDAALARVLLRRMKVANPVVNVATAEEMVSYLLGDGRYADRQAFPYPVLILLDLRLPQKDGIAALAWLRSSRKHRKVPIIMISSQEREGALRTAVQLGAEGYMVKPFNTEVFKRLAVQLKLPVEY